jgi:hypothetical protein
MQLAIHQPGDVSNPLVWWGVGGTATLLWLCWVLPAPPWRCRQQALWA